MNAPITSTLQILIMNPSVTLAWIDYETNEPILHIHLHPGHGTERLAIPQSLSTLQREYHTGPAFRDLRAHWDTPAPFSNHTECQNEPIQLGCQIQPEKANWFGTAGAPAHWIDDQGKHHWGILSNWHVMAQDQPEHAAQHQPSRSNPNAAAYLDDYQPVAPDVTNFIDAAVADALIDGLHTIAWNILDVDEFARHPVTIAPGVHVLKSGRTTGVTKAMVKATGASARVSYGTFEAVFADQILIEDAGQAFSAPGDSGSLVLAQACKCPAGLLFAGGDKLTLANPIARVCDRFNLSFEPARDEV